MCFSKRNHFRVNNSKKVRGHPTYIYKKVGNRYHFIGITHSEITHRTKNIKLDKNPNPEDPRDSYLRPFSSEEEVSKFGVKKRGWKLSKTDKKKIKTIKKNHKQ